jgi:hypothetical protein
MSSIARIFSVPGGQFGAAVVHPGDTAERPAQKHGLPDDVTAILMELPPTPAEKTEWNNLIADRHELNLRTLAYVERKLAARRADLEAKHELAKSAVREQGAVLEKLKTKLAEDTQDTLKAQNALRLAQTAAFNAEQELKSLSRFASAREIDAVKKRIEAANKKMESAEAASAERAANLNYLKIVTFPAEQRKLDDLMTAEMELDCQLHGKDPVMAALGIQQP